MRALIVIDNLNIGGVATSLYNYLKYASQYLDCDLLVFDDGSIDFSKIPNGVNVLKSTKYLRILGKTRKSLAKQSKFYSYYKAFLALLSKVFGGEFVRRFVFFFVKKTREYDVAISYSQDDGWKSLSKGCNDFVLCKVQARKKSFIVHCDYKNFGGYSPKQLKKFSRFDNIICVSQSCKESFISCFPTLQEKTIVCENFTDTDAVLSHSEPSIFYEDGKKNFVSVCRLGAEKGLLRVVKAMKSLIDEGYDNFSWTIVGGGPEYDNILREIHNNNLEQYVKLIGSQDNPFPYIKNATALLISSLHEAAPMVYGECATLQVPIITTNTCSAKEMVENRNLGLVVDNSESGIETILRQVLSGELSLNQYKIPVEEINGRALCNLKDFIKMIEEEKENEKHKF